MSPTSQILSLFSNSNLIRNVPHIQEDLLAECDQLGRLALAQTCVLHRDIYEAYRLSTLSLNDIAFDVRNPDVALITHGLVKKAAEGVWGYMSLSDSRYVVVKDRRPATEKELVTMIIKGRTFHCLSFE